MDDKTDKDLLAVLLLAFNGRDVETLAHTIHAALPKDELWRFQRELDRATRTCVLYSWSAAALREELDAQCPDIYEDEERVWAGHVTDDMLYDEVCTLALPDSAYSGMADEIHFRFQCFEEQGWIIRRKKQSKEGGAT